MAAYDPTDPRQQTPQQRLDAIAAILAVGAGRALALRATAPLAPAAGPQIPLRMELMPGAR